MARTFLNSRIASRLAFAAALSTGLAVAGAPAAYAAKKADAAKGGAQFSDGFRKAAAPIEKAMTDATAKLPASPQPTDFAAAKSAIDTALGGNAKAAFDAANAAATTPDDKNALGVLMRNYGVLSDDLSFKQRGVALSLESGKVAPDAIGRTNYEAGIISYQMQDYAGSAKYLKAAKDAGYVDSSNQLDAVLADAYKRSNNPQAALDMAKQDVDAARAKGVAPSETSLRSALQATYDAKQLAPSTEYAALLAQYYPGTWSTAISVVRQLASLPREQNVDLMRLMFITNAMGSKNDYLEYLDNLDPRAYPGEALKVMNDGLAKGKLTNAEIAQDKASTTTRIATDKASLPATERDASKPGATGATLVGAGDVFYSYDQPAKAETFYANALGKPGVDANKVELRLGMTQVAEGKYADAQAHFAKVGGTRAPVATLWAAYAASKTAPAAH